MSANPTHEFMDPDVFESEEMDHSHSQNVSHIANLCNQGGIAIDSYNACSTCLYSTLAMNSKEVCT